jgi:hypothetical protein
MKVHHFKNGEDPQTPFAPEWDFSLFEMDLTDYIDDLNELEKYFSEKESEIINRYPPSGDGQTDLGPNSVSSRWEYYNLWSFPEMNNIKNAVRYAHDKFIDYLELPPQKVYSNSWINVMRTGERVGAHNHSYTPTCYLGGILTIAADSTSTYFYSPFTGQRVGIKNNPGTLVLFPNWVIHETDSVIHNGKRITVAMNLINEVGYNSYTNSDKFIRFQEM